MLQSIFQLNLIINFLHMQIAALMSMYTFAHITNWQVPFFEIHYSQLHLTI